MAVFNSLSVIARYNGFCLYVYDIGYELNTTLNIQDTTPHSVKITLTLISRVFDLFMINTKMESRSRANLFKLIIAVRNDFYIRVR